MRRSLKKILNVFTSLFFNPLELIYKWRALPIYFSNLVKYRRLNRNLKGQPIRFSDLFFVTYDKFMPAGIMNGTTFSRIDGFVAHRVFSVETVLAIFSELELEEFSLIDDKGKSISKMLRTWKRMPVITDAGYLFL